MWCWNDVGWGENGRGKIVRYCCVLAGGILKKICASSFFFFFLFKINMRV